MKKKYLGFALAALVGGAFVACGDGDVVTPGIEDQAALYTDSTAYLDHIAEATAACKQDPVCASKMNGTPVETSSSSSAPITEPDDATSSSSSSPSSSASTPVNPTGSSSSVVINFSSSSTVSPALSSSSSVTIVDDGTVNGTCAPVPATISKGASTVWTFTIKTPAGLSGITASQKASYSWSLPNSAELEAAGVGVKEATGTYAASGSFGATLVVDGNTIQCSPLQVNGAPITGCTCTPTAETVDVASGAATATWNVTGCTSTGAEITGYTWTGATGTGESATASLSTKGETITPTVTVANNDNTSTEFTCGAVKAIDSSAPEYEISGSDILMPSGACGTVTTAGNLRLNTAGWQATNCSIVLTIGSNKQEKSFANCNFSNEFPTAVSVGDQACVEITGADSVKVVVTTW